MRFSLFLIMFLIGATSAQAGITSPDHTFVANDQYSSDFHTRLNRNTTQLTDGVNNITTAQVTNDTLTEADMADEINPRIRTYEGAACEFVYTGLLPATSASLTSNISSGTAYPRGYRINKASATSKTYTASKWTYVDVDINGDFQYTEVTIDSTEPSVAANSIRLARVSTDSTTINTVTDLRTTSCTAGPFENIADETGEATLEDVLINGAPVRRFSIAGRTPDGFAQGAFVSFDTATQFKVTAGSLYINGKYRAVSQDITVTTAADSPATGGSGIDTTFSGGPKTYYVYGVADQDAVKTFSVTFSESSTAPSGVTNARKLGIIKTNAVNSFISRDVVTMHGVNEMELVSGWINFDGTATVISSADSLNVSGITDNGSGDWTVAWDYDYPTSSYAVVTSCGNGGDTDFRHGVVHTKAAGSVRVLCGSTASGAEDNQHVSVVSIGDARR